MNAATLLVFYMIADEGYHDKNLIISGIIFTVFSLKILPPFVFMLLHYKAFNPRTIKTKVTKKRISSENSIKISARNFELIHSSELSENLILKK